MELAALMEGGPVSPQTSSIANVAPVPQPPANVQVEESEPPTKQHAVEEAKPAVINTNPKPTFETLISFQLSDGKWNKECEGVLKDFFTDSNIQDAVIDAVLSQAKSEGSSADPQMIHYTLIALYILRETFDMKKEEWQMLAKKAKEWLKSVKVPNADKHIKKLSLSLKP